MLPLILILPSRENVLDLVSKLIYDVVQCVFYRGLQESILGALGKYGVTLVGH